MQDLCFTFCFTLWVQKNIHEMYKLPFVRRA